MCFVVGGFSLLDSNRVEGAKVISGNGKSCGRVVQSSVQHTQNRHFSLDEFFASSDVPKSIPDGPNGIVTSILNISPSNTDTVNDVNVHITITHTWIRDLRISLIAHPDPLNPDSILEVVLLERFPGDSTTNMTDCIFDDEAADSIYGGIPPFTGVYQPLNLLSQFDGLPLAGEWTLKIIDQFHLDTGSVQAWGLDFNPPSNLEGHIYKAADNSVFPGAHVEVVGAFRQAITNSDGYYEISSIPTGTYNLVFSATNYDPDTVENVYIRSDSLTIQNAYLSTRYSFLDFASHSRSVIIPDTLTPRTLDTASMALIIDTSLIINDLDVTVNIQHSFAGDLTLTLFGPTGQSVVLAPDYSIIYDTGNADYTDCRFDDEATNSITTGRPPFTGTWKPSNSLSFFDGRNTSGTWRLFCKDNAAQDNGSILNYTLHVTVAPLAVQEVQAELPQSFVFYGNYPNPFNASTVFRFDLVRTSQVKLILYNIMGQQVAVIANSFMEPGMHTIAFDGSVLSSGLYFARLSTSNISETKKVVLLK